MTLWYHGCQTALICDAIDSQRRQHYSVKNRLIIKICFAPPVIDCKYPGEPRFGSTISDEGYQLGATITYQCNRGYRRDGPDIASCTDTGRWEPAELPTCRGKNLFFFFYLRARMVASFEFRTTGNAKFPLKVFLNECASLVCWHRIICTLLNVILGITRHKVMML